MLRKEVEVFEHLKQEFIEKYGQVELERLSGSKANKRTLQALVEGLIRGHQSKMATKVGSDKKRVTMAVKAITGLPPVSWANERDDHAYLLHMAEIRNIELKSISLGQSVKRSSAVRLAEDVLQKDQERLDSEIIDKSVKRLSDKFKAFWAKWSELEQDKLAHLEAIQVAALTVCELTLRDMAVPFYAYE